MARKQHPLSPSIKLESKKNLLAIVFGIAMSTCVAHAGNLRIDSWRLDDQQLWNTKILPVFHATNPNIKVTFSGINPLHYDAVLRENINNKTAGDLIACRPFAQSLNYYNEGKLVDLSEKINLRSFRSITKVAWSTEDGKSTFCLPIASVTSGFFYNKKIFQELDLEVPETEDQFFKTLDSILKSEKYTPIAFGTEDRWESTQVALASIGPNEWKGEAGRKNLITKKIKFTDPQFVSAFEKLAKLKPYLSPKHASMNYEQARNLFTDGLAAMFLSGSWNASYIENIDPDLFGVFKYPTKKINDDCYITNHMDMGIGINADSPNIKDAVVFMKWLTTKEFSEAFANAISGFMPLSSHAVLIQSPLASDIYQWRRECRSTIRINSQYLDNGPQPLEQLLWEVSAGVINHTLSPADATREIHQSLQQWFYKK